MVFGRAQQCAFPSQVPHRTAPLLKDMCREEVWSFLTCLCVGVVLLNGFDSGKSTGLESQPCS